MENILNIVISDEWGSAISVIGVLIVVALSIYQCFAGKLTQGVMVLLIGLVVINGLLAFFVRLF